MSTHTHPNKPARSGGAQPKPEPKHTHPRRAPQPGVAGCKQSAHTSTQTAQHCSQEWRGAAETRAQTHTPTARTPARSNGVQAERPHQHTRTPTPQAGVAGCSRGPSPDTHTHGAHPSQEWRGASGAPRPAHTQPNTRARSGGAQPKPEPKHTHPPRAPQPGVAGCELSTHTSTHTPQHPSQEWRGASGAPRPAHTQPNTRARSGGAEPKPEPKHTHPPRAPQQGVAGCELSTHTSTHTPQHPSQEWRGAAETRAQTQTPTPRTRARSGWVQAERPHEHTHSPTPQAGVAGRSRNPSSNTHTHTAHPSQEWQGASGARTQAHTHPNTPARSGGAQPKPEPKHTHPRRTPQPGVAGCKRSAPQADTNPHTPAGSGGVQPEPEPNHTHPHGTPQPGVARYKRGAHRSAHTPQHPSEEWRGAVETRNPTTTQTQTQAPRNSRKPSVHSPGTEAARAMQGTRPNEIRRPAVRLHPKACAALGLEAERATPKHLGTPVPRTCMHALGTGYARKSGEPLGFRPKEGTCASTGAHPPGMTSSHAGGDQPSRCCPGPLCWGPPIRSSGM